MTVDICKVYIARPSKGMMTITSIVHRWWVRIWLNKPIRARNCLPHVGQAKLVSSRGRSLFCLCLRSSLFFSALAILLLRRPCHLYVWGSSRWVCPVQLPPSRLDQSGSSSWWPLRYLYSTYIGHQLSVFQQKVHHKTDVWEGRSLPCATRVQTIAVDFRQGWYECLASRRAWGLMYQESYLAT